MSGRRVVTGWMILLGVTACGTRKTENVKMPASGTMMAGDSMAMIASALLAPVRANLDSLNSTVPALRDSALAHHAAVLDGLFRAMRTDLMHLGLHGDSAYLALADSAAGGARAIGAASTADQAALVHRQIDVVGRLLAVYGELVARGMH